MSRKNYAKNSKLVEETTDRREYKIMKNYIAPYEFDCGICPLRKFCDKLSKCNPDRIFERNWKSQRKNQWK